MMGSGKSAIGKILANKLDYNFIDVDKMIEIETKKKIDDITGKINLLTENFQKPDYPLETEQELNERLKAVEEEGGWGITKINAGSGSIENTLEKSIIDDKAKNWDGESDFGNFIRE